MDEIIDIDDIINNHMLNKVGSVNLTNYQIEVLKKYNIDISSSKDLKDIMIKIETIINTLDDDEYLELDNIYQDISERNYYENTNK